MAVLFAAYSASHWLVVFPAPAAVTAPGSLHHVGFSIHCDWL
jgi:hypothetical protein